MENDIQNEVGSSLPVFLSYGQLKQHENNQKTTYKYKVYSYSDGGYKVIEYKNERSKTTPKVPPNLNNGPQLTEEEKEANLEESRRQNLYKVKRKITDYIRNNDFDTFYTLTFDPKIYGVRDDLRFKEMRKYLQAMARKYGLFNYIAIPERHKSGAIHWHMITGGFTPKLVYSGLKRKKVRIYNAPEWKYGFSDVQKVRSKNKIANYISKYITKELMDNPARRNKKKYWASRTLKQPETFAITEGVDIDALPNFESEVCKIYEFNSDDFHKYFDKEKSALDSTLEGIC